MKPKLFAYTLLLVLIMFTVPPSVKAQTGTPPAPTEPAAGEVLGRIVNHSPGGEIPGQLDIMLHAWDQTQTEKLMLHGQSNPDGSFSFENVAFEPGVMYAVMATYQDAIYFSEPAIPEPGESSLTLDVPIYESTQDLSNVQIEQMHVLFYWSPGGLSVSEVYIMSNTGEYTVKDAMTLDDGTPVTYKLSLPDKVSNLNFEHDSNGRFLQFPGGFADTAPLVPGNGSNQVMVSYVLPCAGHHKLAITC